MKEQFKINLPITIYNTRDKEPVGLFATPALCARYVFKHYTGSAGPGRIGDSVKHKTVMEKDVVFSFPITARYCNPAQKELLGENSFYIYEGYPEPVRKRMAGFDSTVMQNRRVRGKD